MEGAVFKGIMFGNTTDHVVWCVFGILVSIYALYVETMKKKDPKYVAVCDINDSMSCSRVLTSEYSMGFGLVHYLVGKESMLNAPNCVIGIIFFSIQLWLGLSPYTWTYHFLLYTSAMACLGCIYLCYILFFVLKDTCLVCLATYITNGVLLYLNYQRFAYAMK